MKAFRLVLLGPLFLGLWPGRIAAQPETAGSADAQPSAPAADNPPPAVPPAEPVEPATAPAAAPTPQAAPGGQPPPQEPSSIPAQPAPDATAQPQDEPQERDYSETYYEPPPPPDPNEDKGSGIPGFSIRIDPFNWLLAGRLGLELEVAVWKFLSVELVPVFVTSEAPPWFNFGGRDDNLTQHSDGPGPISGVSLGVGFWFSGKPLKGMLLRGIFTNYAYDYESRDNGVFVDRVGHTEQHFGVTLGSYNRYGAFILGGELGLSSELNDEERCIAAPGCGELQLQAFPDPDTTAYNLNGVFHPIYLEGRFSLGVAID